MFDWIKNLLSPKPSKPSTLGSSLPPPPMEVIASLSSIKLSPSAVLPSSVAPPSPVSLRRVYVVHQRGIAMGAGWSLTEARHDAAKRAHDYDNMDEPTARAWALSLPVFLCWIMPGEIHAARTLLGLELDDVLRCA